MSEWILEEDRKTIVQNIPIVSVNLLVQVKSGIVLGRRTNEPSEGEWFIPGGRVCKGETRTDAVTRIAKNELGVDVEIIESLGALEHMYETAEVEGAETKHYPANGYVVRPVTEEFRPDVQHADLQVLESVPDSLHPYVRAYINEAEMVSSLRLACGQ